MSSRNVLRKFVAALLFCAFITSVNSSSIAKRRQATQRKIVSDDFTKNRVSRSDPNSKTSQAQAVDKQPRPRVNRTYRFASSKTEKPASKAHRTVTAQLGITIWRLRPMVAKDQGATVSVKENDKLSKWVAERVESDTVFNKGDFVRLSVESPRVGYLYVVNQDQFADDTTGNPVVIYPWGGMAPNDNRVQPGRIVDIPSHEDDPSYFRASPTKANQVGELLTFIVTKAPLDLTISNDPLTISKAQLASWKKQWGSNSERFEMEGGAGELWTEKEKQAASRTRARQLTRTDPAPQTIIRITGANTSGFLVNVRLAYAK